MKPNGNLVNLPRPKAAAPSHIWFPFEAEKPETKGTAHFHWGITAFTSIDESSGEMRDAVQVEVEASDEGTAIFRAMDIIQRPGYRVTWVREACSLDEKIARG